MLHVFRFTSSASATYGLLRMLQLHVFSFTSSASSTHGLLRMVQQLHLFSLTSSASSTHGLLRMIQLDLFSVRHSRHSRLGAPPLTKTNTMRPTTTTSAAAARRRRHHVTSYRIWRQIGTVQRPPLHALAPRENKHAHATDLTASANKGVRRGQGNLGMAEGDVGCGVDCADKLDIIKRISHSIFSPAFCN